MSRLTDELDVKARQRSADMREAQGLAASAADEQTVFGLYTYQTLPAAGGTAAKFPPAEGEPHVVCHIYAPGSQEQCQQAGRILQEAAASANEPPLLYMVLPTEPLPV